MGIRQLIRVTRNMRRRFPRNIRLGSPATQVPAHGVSARDVMAAEDRFIDGDEIDGAFMTGYLIGLAVGKKQLTIPDLVGLGHHRIRHLGER